MSSVRPQAATAQESAGKASDISVAQLDCVGDEDAKYFVSLIRTIPGFPKKGILFRDFMPLLADARGLAILIRALRLSLPVPADDFDSIAGLEARGFLFGPALAAALGKGFIALRKTGKLPPETLSEQYTLEYGQESVEIEDNAISSGERVLVVDDLIATGGSANAASHLIEKSGGNVAGFSFVMELEGLGGRSALGDYPISTLVTMPA
ncbi:adenine phosphoribosyltransferase [Bifidobacterium sp.]|jgi:adenine phosphoribosyltransferase|uniref:adenine phosphoribosyltransferase n=1 Tax=Bifidobacterium sp. TaxID=41200 RepID=UPI0025C5493C|nr:adenine phosphoribosyltransferase [Bifidobacterium sp.]MCH4208541.1 adenine phosphoribosyltransferase [Bifidobacterium sp.]MCI1224227.1 adenine phosphoribosyltransferase [Bifidobacterium sp.]